MTLLSFFLLILVSSIAFLFGVSWGYTSGERDSLKEKVQVLSQYIQDGEDEERARLEQIYGNSEN